MAINDCLLHLRGMFPSLRPAEQRVATEILENPEEVVHLSITELAKRAQVSDATVVKFCKRIGYKGFQELKIRLAQDVVVKPKPIYGEIEIDDDISVIKHKIFHTNISALQDTPKTLDNNELAKAVDALGQARKIQFYGLGASGIVAQDAEHKFLRIGLDASAFIDSHLQTTMASLLGPNDVAIGITYSGETWEIVEALKAAEKTGATTICLTNFPQSSITEHAQIKLLTSSSETIFRSGAIASRIAQLSTIDTLFIGVALAQFEKSVECIEKTRNSIADRKFGK